MKLKDLKISIGFKRDWETGSGAGIIIIRLLPVLFVLIMLGAGCNRKAVPVINTEVDRLSFDTAKPISDNITTRQKVV